MCAAIQSRPLVRAASFLSLLFASMLLVAACAEPPSKEMNQAQGAIDAARAAGAEEYAADELANAINTLKQSEAAVTARDYRLALAHALDSREYAQNAAKAAVDGRAKARGDAERVIAEVATLVERLETRLEDPEIARLPRRARTAPADALATANKALQEARAALKNEEYAKVLADINGLHSRLQAMLDELDTQAAGSGRARKR
jgi:hypothetical protein